MIVRLVAAVVFTAALAVSPALAGVLASAIAFTTVRLARG